MQPDTEMKETTYCYEIIESQKEITQTYSRYIDIIFSDKYFSKFSDLPDFGTNFPSMLLYLWKKYKENQCSMTIEKYKEELRQVIDENTFKKEMEGSYDEFQDSYAVVQSFLSDAEEEYYAGFIGALRKLIRPKKAHQKIE